MLTDQNLEVAIKDHLRLFNMLIDHIESGIVRKRLSALATAAYLELTHFNQAMDGIGAYEGMTQKPVHGMFYSQRQPGMSTPRYGHGFCPNNLVPFPEEYANHAIFTVHDFVANVGDQFFDTNGKAEFTTTTERQENGPKLFPSTVANLKIKGDMPKWATHIVWHPHDA